MSNARTLASTINSNNEIVVPSGGIAFIDLDSSNDPATANESYVIGQDGYEEGTFSPTVSSTSGTITTVSANGFYRKIGTTVICFIDFTVTTNGTGAGLGNISGLPFSTTASSESSGAMRIDGFNGRTAAYTLDKSSTTIILSRYDNTYPFGNNARGTLVVPYIVA